MPVSPELLQRFAREWLERENFPDDIANETAARLNTLLARLRTLDETRLRDLLPAMAFNPSAAAYAVPPQTPPVWEPLAQGEGTGYGGRGTTGVEAAPHTPKPIANDSPEWLWWDATTLAAALRKGDLRPTEVVEAALARLHALEPTLNAFVTVTEDQARAAAQRLETALARGEAGALAGVPVAFKDLFETAGVRTTGGSHVLADYVPTRDATAVRRLLAADAVSLGKTTTHEFAFGPTTDSPYLGPTRNPWNPDHVPAGSSGGSGAAVAAGIVPLALGTDTGGSVRMPAAACGVVGLKPTYGRVSKFGVLPLSWSLDHVGPLARSVADAALALRLLAGGDPLDPSTVPIPPDDYQHAVRRGREETLRGLR
ncbi:amidase, partial [Ardenticatena maritima]